MESSTIVVLILITASALAYALPMVWLKSSNAVTSTVTSFFTFLTIMFYVFIIKGYDVNHLKSIDIKTVAFTGLLYGVGALIYLEAIKYGKLNLLKLQTIIMFIISSLIAYFIVGENMNRQKIGGIILLLVGTALFVCSE